MATAAPPPGPQEYTIQEQDLVDDVEVDSLVREAIAQEMGDSQFNHSKQEQWSSHIVEGCLKRLAALGKPFKYVVTATLAQNAGAGLHMASSCWWAQATDSKLAVQWENATTFVLVIVCWLAV